MRREFYMPPGAILHWREAAADVSSAWQSSARMNESPGPNPAPASGAPRRGFVKALFAAVLGGVAVLGPALAGLFVFLDPLRRSRGTSRAVRVASLEALPEDGVPRRFPVIASRTDAWNKFPRVPVGAVYLRRTGSKEVVAFNVICPHAGCLVDFNDEEKNFLCPCHNSAFALDGRRANENSPSPRDLDTLKVEFRKAPKGTDVWVHFQNFRTGVAQKIPEA
jgi:Rieske Fe-S protein